jgi:hypothetical protein
VTVPVLVFVEVGTGTSLERGGRLYVLLQAIGKISKNDNNKNPKPRK